MQIIIKFFCIVLSILLFIVAQNKIDSKTHVNKTENFGKTKNGENVMIEEIIRYAAMAPSGHNTQPWKFCFSGDTISIIPDYSRSLPIVDPEDREMFISLGCALENMVIAANRFGYDTRISYELNNPSAEKIVIVLSKVRVQYDDTLFEQIEKRQTTRSEYDGQNVSPDLLKEIQSYAQCNNGKLKFITDSSRIDKIIDLVKSGNIIQFNNKLFLDELIFWIRFNRSEAEEKKDGLISSVMGSPSVPRWLGKLFLNLFMSADKQNDKDERLINSSAGLVLFYSEEENKKTWIDVGRAFERFSLLTTKNNIKCAFINQPIEVEELRIKLTEEFEVHGKYPQLLLRYGYAEAMPRSPRRNLNEMIVN